MDELKSRIYAKIDELPTLPAVIPKILGLIESDKSNAADIARAISNDPALSSKVLKVANSAYYGFSREISSLENAVPLLGFRMVKSLALSLGIIRAFPKSRATPRFSQAGLWIHSVAVGTAIRGLARRHGKTSSPEHLFTIGILHDIGKLVLDQFFHDLHQQALVEAQAGDAPPLHTIERRLIGLDHGEIGGMLLERWRLPREITEPIAAHHRADAPDGAHQQAIAMLRIADAVVQELGIGSEGETEAPAIPEGDRTSLNLTEEDLAEIKSELQRARDRIYAFFGAMS